MKVHLIALMAIHFAFASVPSWAQSPGHASERPSIFEDAFQYPPFQVFDNLHYLGIGWVAAWLIDTSDGLVLIDTLYGKHTDALLDRIRECGFDPADVKYAFVTHAHFDHCGGIERIKEATGATIGMTPADWTLFAENAGGHFPVTRFNAIPVDLMLYEGDQITLGDTTFTFHETPGHTEGVLSIEFPVRDGDAEYKAFTFGGAGLNFLGSERTQRYIDTVDRILAMDGIQVNVPNHASDGSVFFRYSQLKLRKPGKRHPFVAPDDFQDFLKDRRAAAEQKLDKGNLEDAVLKIFPRNRKRR